MIKYIKNYNSQIQIEPDNSYAACRSTEPFVLGCGSLSTILKRQMTSMNYFFCMSKTKNDKKHVKLDKNIDNY